MIERLKEIKRTEGLEMENKPRTSKYTVEDSKPKRNRAAYFKTKKHCKASGRDYSWNQTHKQIQNEEQLKKSMENNHILPRTQSNQNKTKLWRVSDYFKLKDKGKKKKKPTYSQV